MRILLATNHFADLGGSELVICELAEEFKSRGHDVNVFTNFALPTYISEVGLLESEIIVDYNAVDLNGYDLVYCLHSVLPLLFSDKVVGSPMPALVFGHLSAHEPMEAPGPILERTVSSLTLCNSEETRRAVALSLPSTPNDVMPNPAPNPFWSCAPSPSDQLRRLLIVSNHPPDEVVGAIQILRQAAVDVIAVGVPWSKHRVTPEDFSSCDAVLTIGKTVQYAIAARRPAFVYDKFGGPGWLKADNFSDAALFNFSGRSEPRCYSADALAQKILSGYHAAADFALTMTEELRAPYRLEFYVAKLLALANDDEVRCRASQSVARMYADTLMRSAFVAEQSMSLVIRRTYQHIKYLEAVIHKNYVFSGTGVSGWSSTRPMVEKLDVEN